LNRPSSVIIIGGGIIGCSIAYELIKQGIRTTVVDKGALLSEATTAAAGMLGAQAETHSPGPFYELCKLSQRMYADWTEELEAASGISSQYRSNGIIRAALTEEDEAELQSRLNWMDGAEWLSPAEVRQLEPGVTSQIRGGLHFAQDHQIHPVHLAGALRAALIRYGCVLKEWLPAMELLTGSDGAIIGVRTAEGPLYADQVVLAAGAWSASLVEPLGIQLPMFPVKGQCISVRPRTAANTHTVFVKGCYAVPKLDGTVLIGATQVEAGFDKRAAIEVIGELFQSAVQLLPALAGAELVSTWAGLRPGTPDGLPYLGRLSAASGLAFAAGHYRNGILLGPVTGKAIAGLLMKQPAIIDLAPFTPERVQR
jgi:glycine oxidase